MKMMANAHMVKLPGDDNVKSLSSSDTKDGLPWMILSRNPAMISRMPIDPKNRGMLVKPYDVEVTRQLIFRY